VMESVNIYLNISFFGLCYLTNAIVVNLAVVYSRSTPVPSNARLCLVSTAGSVCYY